MGFYIALFLFAGILAIKAEEVPDCRENFTLIPNEVFDTNLPDVPCKLDFVSEKETFIFFDILQLQPEDTLSIEVQPINSTALPILLFKGDSKLIINGVKGSPRRMRFHVYVNECNHTYNLYSPQPLKLQSPLNLSPAKDILKCTLRFNTSFINNASLSISLLDGSLDTINLTATHPDNSTEEFNGAKHDFIEQAGTYLEFTLNRSQNLSLNNIMIELEPVNKDCSGEVTNFPFGGQVVANATRSNPDLECRYVVTNPENGSILVGNIVSLSSSPDGFLDVLAGGTKRDTSLFMVASKSMSYYEGEYFLPSSGSNSFLIRFNHLNITFNYSLIEGEGGHIDPPTENEKRLTLPFRGDQKENLYLLHGHVGQNVVLRCPSFPEGTLSVYSDFKDKAFLLNVSKGENYPLVSPASLMMVKASFGVDVNCSVTFVKEGCNKMSLGKAGTYTLSNDQCQENCFWSVPPQQGKGYLLLNLFNLTLEDKDKVKLSSHSHTLLTLNKTVVEIPEIAIPLEDGFNLEVERGDSKASHFQLGASFVAEPDCNAVESITPGEERAFFSPNFPDSYPLNSHCLQTAKSEHLLLTIDSLSLSPAHCLSLKDGANKKVLINDSSAPDNLFSLNVTLNFTGSDCTHSSGPLTITKPYSGYKVTLRGADCGGEITNASGLLTPPQDKTYCIWTIKLNDDKNIVSYNVSITGKTVVTVYDGKSIRNKSTDFTENRINDLSHTNYLIVVYNRSKTSKKDSFTLNFKTYECTAWCNVTQYCMHPDWKCNGKNDCGDWSDELNCTGPSPTPEPCPKDLKWSDGSFAAAIILSLIFGCAVAYAFPRVYRRCRANPYQPFSSNLE